MNDHLVTLFCDDVRNTVNTLLGEIKEERLIPHLPRRAPVAPFNEMTVMGSAVREFVVRATPVWAGNTRVTITDDLIVVDVRDAEGRWLECWRSDVPNVTPQHTGAPVPKPVPAPEPEPVSEPSRFGPIQPGQLCVTPDGRFTIAK
jgi:hypothetical protein